MGGDRGEEDGSRRFLRTRRPEPRRGKSPSPCGPSPGGRGTDLARNCRSFLTPLPSGRGAWGEGKFVLRGTGHRLAAKGRHPFNPEPGMPISGHILTAEASVMACRYREPRRRQENRRHGESCRRQENRRHGESCRHQENRHRESCRHREQFPHRGRQEPDRHRSRRTGIRPPLVRRILHRGRKRLRRCHHPGSGAERRCFD
jgi:hypothetical protein